MPKADPVLTTSRRELLARGAGGALMLTIGAGSSAHCGAATATAPAGGDAELLSMLGEIAAIDAAEMWPRWGELIDLIADTPALTAAGQQGKARMVYELLLEDPDDPEGGPSEDEEPVNFLAWSLARDVLRGAAL